MKFNIRIKLIAFTFCIILLVGGSISLYFIYQGRQRILETFKEDALQTTTLLSGTLINDLYFLDISSLRHRLRNARVNPDISHTYVMDSEGILLTDGTGQNPMGGQKLTDNLTRELLQSKDWVSQVEDEMFKVGLPLVTSDGVRIGHLQVGFSLDNVYRIVHVTTRASLYITLACLIIGAALAFVVATGFSRPIESIVKAALAIGQGHLDTRLAMKRGDEFATLAESINRMAGALQLRGAEAEEKTRQLQALNAIAMATSQSLDLKELFEIALDKTVEVSGRQRVNIRLKDPLTGRVELIAHRGFSDGEIEELRRRTPHPMSEEVFASGNPLIINDTGENSSRDFLDRTRSVAWVPIKAGARVVGVLGISDNQSKPFSVSEVELLEAIGSVIGVAIENARLFGETKRNLEGIRALHEIDMAITSTLDLRDVLRVLMDKIDLFLPYSTATVRLFNKESALLEPVACRNLDEAEWKVAAWKPGRGPANAVFESRAPLMIRDCLNDPRVKDREFFRKHRLVSYLGVPMFAKEEILGVLSFYTNEEHEFTNEEVEFLTALAGQAAIAIHNSEVYEEMAKLAADLSRSNKVKDEFLSVMSHELRTPLNVVMGYTGMIKDRLLGEINPEQEKALEKVISRARDQLTMISSILQATQLEAEGIKVERREVSLKDFLDDLKSNYSIPLGKEISLVWDYPSDLPVISTDGEKLKHVLQNLINNAIKFTDKGFVTISAHASPLDQLGVLSNVEGRLAPQASERWVEFKVADTGIGIAKEFFPVIFERFHQVDSSETRKYGGVGIGLYIVKKFTELLGGKVELESEEGKGSTFTVTIPVANHQEAGKEEARDLASSA